jgi:peptidoglycan/LPS O-acetylase OafA/YrhL
MTYPLYLIHQIAGAALLALLLPVLARPAAMIALVAVLILVTLWLVEAEARLRRRLAAIGRLGTRGSAHRPGHAPAGGSST